MKRFHRLRASSYGLRPRNPLARPCVCGKVHYRSRQEAEVEAKALRRRYDRPFYAARCRGVYDNYRRLWGYGWHVYLTGTALPRDKRD